MSVEATYPLISPEGTTAAQPTPAGSRLGYGTDLRCSSDLTEQMEEIEDPFSTLALAEAIVRRLDCPRGQLVDDPDYGLDLRSMCNRGMTADALRALGGQVRAELLKDDRIDLLGVTVRPSSTGKELRVELAVTPVDAHIGGFALTLAVTSAEVLLEELR